MNVVLTLSDGQLEEIAQRVAEILASREAAAPAGELLTVTSAAALAGVTPKTLRNWFSLGRLTRRGAPGTPLVDRGELLALLAPGSPSDGRGVRPKRPGKPRPAAGTFTDMARRA